MDLVSSLVPLSLRLLDGKRWSLRCDTLERTFPVQHNPNKLFKSSYRASIENGERKMNLHFSTFHYARIWFSTSVGRKMILVGGREGRRREKGPIHIPIILKENVGYST